MKRESETLALLSYMHPGLCGYACEKGDESSSFNIFERASKPSENPEPCLRWDTSFNPCQSIVH